MAQKETREAEPDSVPGPTDAVASQRRQFASWVEGVQHSARIAKTASNIAPSSPPPSARRSAIDSERPPVVHQIPEEVLRAARVQRSAAKAASAPLPSPAAPSSGPASPSSPVASPRPAAPSSPVASSRPDGASNPFASFREELPADELTAVFSPPAELLARSGRQPATGGDWEEPTQVVHVGDVLEALASSPSYAPPSEGPTFEQLHFEREPIALATPVSAAPRRTHLLLWAVAALLAGAVTAAVVEYTLHPPRVRTLSPAGAGVGIDLRCTVTQARRAMA